MSEVAKDEGVVQVLLERFEKFRLPRAIDIKARIDAGEKLTDNDIAFLERVMSDAEEIKRYVDKVPDMQPLYVRAVSLYQDITKKALENEQNS